MLPCVFTAERSLVLVAPVDALTYAQDLADTELAEQTGVVGMVEVAEVHVVCDAGGKATVDALHPLRGRGSDLLEADAVLGEGGGGEDAWLDCSEESNVGGVGEKVALVLLVELDVGGVKRDAVGVHVVGYGEEGGLGVAVGAVEEELAARCGRLVEGRKHDAVAVCVLSERYFAVLALARFVFHLGS